MRTFDNYLNHTYERRAHHYDVLCDFIFFFQMAETGFHTVLRHRPENEKIVVVLIFGQQRAELYRGK